MFTTSRYASNETKILAKAMAQEAGAGYIARGKKTVDSLAQEARRQGDAEICIIEERKGRPAKVARITVDEAGKWSWSKESPVPIKDAKGKRL
jgi:rRNA maturation protein Rpf1